MKDCRSREGSRAFDSGEVQFVQAFCAVCTVTETDCDWGWCFSKDLGRPSSRLGHPALARMGRRDWRVGALVRGSMGWLRDSRARAIQARVRSGWVCSVLWSD